MKIGIMSFAHLHAEAYIQNLQNIPDVEFIGFTDANSERGQYFANLFGARLLPSYQALLHEQPDGVLICSENNQHQPLVEMAARAGTAILCEKPLATTLADCHTILKSCHETQAPLMIAFPMRFSAPIIQLKTMLAQKKLGHIYGFSTTNQGQIPINHRAWFVDPILAGGGAIMDHTVHLADILRWLLDDEVVEVYAQTNNILYEGQVHVETAGLIMLTFANGTFATIDCSWSKPLNYPTWGGLTMRAITEKGVVDVDAFSQNLNVYPKSPAPNSWAYWGSDANQAMIEAFIQSIRQGSPPPITGNDGLKTVEIVAAAYQSMKTNAPVNMKQFLATS